MPIFKTFLSCIEITTNHQKYEYHTPIIDSRFAIDLTKYYGFW